jgi:putative FmdB family regulatory protein
MPLYEYECTACHRRTEKIQKFSDPELTVCPHCGGPLERTITAAAISFKGGGWYADGYASHKPAASSGEGSGGESGSGSDSAGSVDSSASLTKSSGEGAKSSESTKPAESAKPPAAAAPAPSHATKA